ncbi:MAG: hypothetical protein JXA95_12605 [Spirochaetales bacterium]|nr:hypothetical protein [Spirochaetales bacterium]
MKRLYSSLTEAMVLHGTMKPASLADWFYGEYEGSRPGDILEVNDRLLSLEMPLTYTMTWNLIPFRTGYMYRLACYLPGKNTRSVYLYRLLADLDEDWERRLPGILAELDYRLAGKRGTYLSDPLFVESFTVQYYNYYELSSGDYSFTEMPFIILEKKDYHRDDDLFSEWLALRLHLSGIFPVVMDDQPHLTKEGDGHPSFCTWGIKGQVKISEVFSLLRVDIFNYRRQETVGSYDFPFEGQDMAAVSALIESVLPFIYDRILSNEVKRDLVLFKPDFHQPLESTAIYTKEGYQGPRDLVTLFPARLGLNRFLVQEDQFLPVDLSGFNEAHLVGPGGEVFGVYTEREIRYAEKLFEE